MAEPIHSTIAGVSLVTLAVALVGPAAGPYLVIVLGAIGGGLWALSSTPLQTRWQGAGLMFRCVLTAVVLTALIANVIGPWFGIEVIEVYVVVSFVIGMLGNKWLEVIESIKLRLQALISTSGDKS
jgi:hypothetical protein